MPLFICLAEPERPGGGARFASNIQTLVEAETGVRFDARRSETITKGHTAGAEALQLVGRALGSGIGSCIVCAVDSYLNAETLHWLEVAHRLKRRGNSNGVIPGEAAAAILVERNAALEGDEAARIRITGIGFGEEPATVFSKDPMLGRGLADAGRAALAQSGRRAEEIAFRLSDVTGEAYGFKEQALAIARLLRSRREEFPIWHASDSIGDVGAASGLVQVIMASEGFKKHYAPGSRAICFSTGVGRHRASVVVEDQA